MDGTESECNEGRKPDTPKQVTFASEPFADDSSGISNTGNCIQFSLEFC